MTNTPPHRTPTVSRRGVLATGAVGSALAASGLTVGSPTPADAATDPRRVLSFDESWLFERGAAVGAQAPTHDDSSWRRLSLPHDWSIEDLPNGSDDGAATNDPSLIADVTDPTFNDGAPSRIGPFDKALSPGGKSTGHTVGGEGWYRKHFAVGALAAGQRVILAFGGVYANSDVWLNGTHLGFHPNGYTPFQYDLTPYLRSDDRNVLAVQVRNTGRNSRWYTGSGIYRHTTLLIVNPVHVPWQGVAITTPEATRDAARVDTSVNVRNLRSTPAEVQVRVSVLDPSGAAVATRSSLRRVVDVGGSTEVAVSLPVVSPRLWSLEDPALYRARVEILQGGKVLDRVTETFGIRTISFDRSGFKLNGTTVKMRGGCIHHDHGPLGAVNLYAAEERRIQTMKEAGFNAIRYSHNCPSAEVLEICDRLGILVYDEFTDMWDGGKNPDDYHLHFAEWWKRDLTSMVLLDRNHPSVVIRSIGNEVAFGTTDADAGPSLDERGAEMAAFLRILDPTRPVTQGGGDSLGGGNDSVGYCDLGDVHYERDYATKAEGHPDKPWVQSESYIGSLHDYWQMAAVHDYAIGDFSWTGWDYIGEAGIGRPLVGPVGTGGSEPTDAQDIAQVVHQGQSPYPWYGAVCGDIDHLAELRPQMRYRRVVWGLSDLELLVQRPTAPVESQRAGWAWCDELESWTWDVPLARPMTVRVYTTAEQVELLLNGTSVGIRTLSEGDRRIASFLVPYSPGTLVAVARSGGREVARKRLTTAGAAAALRLRAYRSAVTTSRDDLAYITAEVVDALGNLVPDAVKQVQFGIAGGTLAGVINGNGHNVDSMQRPRRWTYQGKALVVVRPPKTAGTLTVNALSAGLKAASVSIPVLDRPYPAG